VTALLVLMAVLAALAIVKARHVRLPLVSSSGCLARGRQAVVPLTTGQAEIAATIAGVALSRSMPVRAVTIAYAAALQESGLADLPYGDRDSVGVFQQRPSQGWGTRRQLLDPVYASARFFAALARVAGYQRLPVYQAAQAVQHSADGRAYGQYAGQGAAMATAFTGQVPHGVWCWYGSPVRGPGRLAAARRELARIFGRLPAGRAPDPGLRVLAAGPGGWAVASWLVTHAAAYGIRTVTFDGYQWTAASGQGGWRRERPGPRRPPRAGVTFG